MSKEGISRSLGCSVLCRAKKMPLSELIASLFFVSLQTFTSIKCKVQIRFCKIFTV